MFISCDYFYCLHIFKSNFYRFCRNTLKSGSHDCIVLFTDGEATEGITEPEKLIKEYSSKMQEIIKKGRANSVHLVTITIDHEHSAEFLNQVQNILFSRYFDFYLSHYQSFKWNYILIRMVMT